LELYESKKALALEQNVNFAFETNFHSRQILAVVNSFIEKGYKTELIFIYLESVELAIDRVKDRVAKGGHHVDEKTIKERFINGRNLLDESFSLFDIVSLFVSKHRTIEPALILQPKLNNVVSFKLEPLRLLNHLPSINEYVIKYGS
jgi:predicted ABC-type ATPase